MSLLVYAITDAECGGLDPTLGGIGGATLLKIEAAGLVAVASRHDAIPAIEEETLWSFERVIESLMQVGAVLPLRFGTMLATTDDVVSMLERGRAELAHKLDRVRGAVELSVRGTWPDAPAPVSVVAPRTGTDYLQDRLVPQRRARELAARVRADLDGRARASRHRILARPSVPVSAAFLVDRGTEGEFAHAVARLDAQLEDANLVCTGPWPAYSFVGDGRDD